MNTMLKKQQQQLPNHLLTKNKKTNSLIQNHYYKSKITHQRNKLSSLLHHFQPGYLQPQYQGDQTLKVTQKQIIDSVNIQNSSNIFELTLNQANYRCEYSLNGSRLMLTSSNGYLALINWRQKQALLEINLGQSINDSKFLFNDQMISLCQKSNLFIYDNRGVQIHKLDRANGIQYLPYHFLLAAYDNRKLKYYDITTGHIVADHVAKGTYTVMRKNNSNGIIALGNNKGVVEWWTPGVGTPAVKLFAGASIVDVGFHKGYMVTASEDIKVWDSRMLKVVQTYPLHRRINSLEISQTGLLCLNYGFKMQIFKDFYITRQTHPYMVYNSSTEGMINNFKFVNFEDIIGMGTKNGFRSILVPGSGSPYYDTFENNPFESKKQKRQALVHKLLEKLPPQTIVVDPNIIGNIDPTKKQILQQQEKQEQNQKYQQELKKKLKKKKARGKNSVARRVERKQIQADKKRRQELTKVLNSKQWAKWAQKKKKQTQLQIINSMQKQGINITTLPKKSKKIHKQD